MLRIVDLTRNDREPIHFEEMSYFKERIITSIKEILYEGVLKHPTGLLANSIQGYVSGNSIYIISELPYADAQDKGQAPFIMWFLLGKVIPIREHRFGQSRVIFRRATLKSFLAGGWRHPGITAKQFVNRGIGRAMTGLDQYNWHVRTDMGVPQRTTGMVA